MRKKTICAIFSAMSLLSSYAQDAMMQVINTIIENNPEISSQRELIKAQSYENADENSLSDPSVELGRVWGRHGIGNKLQLDVKQEFDWPGLYRARSQAAKEGISAAEMLVNSTILTTSYEAKQLLIELVYVRKQIEIKHLLLDNIRELDEASQKAHEKGLITVLDHKKISIEDYKLDAEIALLYSRESQIKSQLQALCNGVELNLSEITAYPIEPILSKDEYLNQVTELDPLLSSNRFTIEQENINAKVATQSRFPSFSVGYQHQAEMGDRFNGFTLSMSLPFFQNRKARSAALSRKYATELSSEALIAKRIADINKHFEDMELWNNQVQNYQKVFGDNKYLELLRKSYDGGEINIIDYLSEVRYYNETTFAFLEAQYNYNLALACLNQYSLINNLR